MKCLFAFLFLPLSLICQTSQRSLNNNNWQFQKKGENKWFSATVPGTVHKDLLNNKLIPDPFIGDNEKKVQWIENEDWEYRSTIEITKDDLKQSHVDLQFDGLDTYAKVYLNDSLIITADNMFRTWNVEVKKYLHKGNNYIHILFESAVKRGKEEAKKLSYTLPGDEKVFTRKAQYQYGWDFGPRLVTSGIWKDVKLVFWNKAKILSVICVQKSLTNKLAELEFVCEIKSDVIQKTKSLSAWCNLPEWQEGEEQLPIIFSDSLLKKGINICTIKYSINDPHRWWCNGLGKAILYSFSVKLSDKKTILDTTALSIGLRTIELVQQPDSIGKSFYFKLNGVPVFMKGANYIPPDNFLPRVTKKDYENIVQSAADANMNMLRVWGGGVYADDAFYNACDKKGILVWQDLMFACAMYPGDVDFNINVDEEIYDQVIRLMNHPSIAVWCGNNEIDEGWKNWGWQKQYHYSKKDSTHIWNDYVDRFEINLHGIIHLLHPSDLEGIWRNAYIPTSPQIGWGHKESLLQGDSHYWGVWWGMEPFDNYKNKVGRFVSEYGFQGMPSFESFVKTKTYLSFRNYNDIDSLPHTYLFPDKIDEMVAHGDITKADSNKLITYSIQDKSFLLDSINLKSHQKHATGFQTINTYMERYYRIPKDFKNYIYISQLLQADGLKTAIEAHRRAKPKCMGSLYWQLNDCWPGITWCSVDYYGTRKAAYYQAKRAFKNILISIAEENNQYNIYIVNDELKAKDKVLDLKLHDTHGKILWSKSVSLNIKPNSSAIYFSINKNEFSSFDSTQIILQANLERMEGEETDAVYYFAKPKDFILTKPTFNINYISDKEIEITTDVLARSIMLPESFGVLSDNFFDLMPNEKRIITTKGSFPKEPLISTNFEIHSFYDTSSR